MTLDQQPLKLNRERWDLVEEHTSYTEYLDLDLFALVQSISNGTSTYANNSALEDAAL